MAHVPAAGSMLQQSSDTAMSSASSPAPPLCAEGARCLSVHHALQTAGLFESTPAWRVSPVPFPLTERDLAFFETLGPQLWSFSKALNRLYLDSLKGRQPFWVHQYLDQGKPPALLEYARMKRFREAVPQVIRPDVIPTETGMMITELDSVPGGIGITGSLSSAYGALGDTLVGGADGMIDGFATLFRDRSGDAAGEETRDVLPSWCPMRPKITGSKWSGWPAGSEPRVGSLLCASPRSPVYGGPTIVGPYIVCTYPFGRTARLARVPVL